MKPEAPSARPCRAGRGHSGNRGAGRASILRLAYIRMNQQAKPKIVAQWGPAGELAPVQGTEGRRIEGTLDCLRRLGLRGTTSRAIAAAAGANLGAITYYFGSKDELVAQALLRAIRGWVEPALAVLRTDMEPAQRMLASIE